MSGKLSLFLSSFLAVLLLGCSANKSCCLPQASQAGQVCRGWSETGIGQAAGMQTTAISPVDPSKMALGGDMSGFYISNDSGKSWKTVDWKQLYAILPCAPVFHPKEAGTLYCAGKSFSDPYGIRVSRDGGVSWKLLADKMPTADSVLRIYLDRETPDTMFFGTDKGAFLSLDGGKSWNACEGVTGISLNFLTDQSSGNDKKSFFAATKNGIFRSTDGGKTWISKFSKPGMKSFAGGSAEGKCILYCLAGRELWRSSDRGGNWELTAPGIRAAPSPFAVYTAESFPDTVYVTNKELFDIYKSTDSGNSWNNVYKPNNYKNVKLGWITYEYGKGYSGPLTQGTSVCPSNPDILAGCGMGELMVTLDGGKIWNYAYTKLLQEGTPVKGAAWQTQGLEESSSWNYYIDPNNRNLHYICYTDIGFARSEDSGKSWSIAITGSAWPNTVYDLAFDPDLPGVIYGAASNEHDIPHWSNCEGTKYPGGVLKSSDYAKTWTVISDGLPKVACTKLLFDRADNALYAVMYSDGVYKSLDRGKTWVKKSNGLVVKNNSEHKKAVDNTDVYTIAKDRNGTLYCLITAHRIKGTNDYPVPGGLFRSKDRGENWELVASECDGTPLLWPVEFDIDPNDPDTIYLAAMGSLKKVIYGGVFKTVDAGKTWKNITKEITPGVVYPFKPCIDPRNTKHLLLTSEGRGLLETFDGGASWSETDFPFASPQRVLYDTEGGNMYVATFGGGVWKKGLK